MLLCYVFVFYFSIKSSNNKIEERKFGDSSIFFYFCGVDFKIGMRTAQYYITAIRQNSSKITHDFGIKTLRIFGSVSRNEQTESSDLDVCVETETPNPFLLANLKEFLENQFKCSVDVVRFHKNMNPYLKSRIEQDGIYAIR